LPPGWDPAFERLLRRRLGAPVFSSGAGFGATSTGLAAAGVRRPRRRRDVGAAWAISEGAAARAAWALRRTLAPTSPSAHNAPSAVWTSTRQTTMAVGAPPTGGRFWVSVQRA